MSDQVSSAIDDSVVADLLDAIGGDRAFLIELIDTYLGEAPRLLAEMRDAVARGSAEDLVRPVHTLKSSSASLGALRLSERCKILEASARTSSLDGASEEVEGIAEELANASASLTAIRDTPA